MEAIKINNSFKDGSMSSPALFTYVPIEILEHICGYLPLETILNLSATCKRLDGVIFTSPAIMKKISFKMHGYDIIENSLFIRHYQKMDISAQFNIDYHCDFKQYGKYITELVFSCKTESSFVLEILQACKNLEAVYFYDRCRKDFKMPPYGFNLDLPKLKSLCLHESFWLLDELDHTNIEELDIHASFTGRFPVFNNWKIKHLYVKRAIETITNPSEFRIFLHTQKNTLEDLSVATQNRDLISFIFEELNLKTLHISGKYGFPRTSFNDDFFLNTTLTSLTIATQSQIKVLSSERILFDILRRLPALERFTLEFYEAFSQDHDSDFQNLYLPNLRFVQLKRANSNFLKYALLPQLETVSFEVIQGSDVPILMSVRKVIVKKLFIDFYYIGILYPNIEHLRIEENFEFVYAVIKSSLAYYMKNLKILEVANHIMLKGKTPERWEVKSTVLKVFTNDKMSN